MAADVGGGRDVSFRLETERLVLREERESDLAALFAIVGDAETMAYYPRPFTREETLSWIRRNRRRYRERGYGLWVIELKDAGEVIGQCGLTPQVVEGREEIEVGWQVHRAHWNRGYATEAGRAARDFAFTSCGLDHLVSLVRPINGASAAVARKLGMTVRGRTVLWGSAHDIWWIGRAGWERETGAG